MRQANLSPSSSEGPGARAGMGLQRGARLLSTRRRSFINLPMKKSRPAAQTTTRIVGR